MALNKYPKPHFQRKDNIWQNLNGLWTYAILDKHCLDDLELISQKLNQSQLKINVPYSMETVLSTVQKQLSPKQTLLMRLNFDLEIELKEVTKLCFGAVDQQCMVWLNEKNLGMHEDGYLPFEFDVSSILKEKDNELIISIIDQSDQGPYPWGKQKIKRGTIWYTPQSGIWQTVYLETKPKEFVESFYYEYYGHGDVDLFVKTNLKESDYTIIVYHPTLNGQTNEDFLFESYSELIRVTNHQKINLGVVKEYSSEEPWLYPVEIIVNDDHVMSYMGLRVIEIKEDENKIKKIFINQKETFQSGLLDQGYYQNGLYTPDDEQMMLDDLLLVKEMGFNTLRKHIKIDLARWYFDCDRLGIWVHQDMVNGGNNYNPLITQVLPFINIHLKDNQYSLFSRSNPQSRKLSIIHQEKVIDHLKFFCSIVMWVISNEGWGQFDTLELSEKARKQDPTRLIDHASGWHDQKGFDFKSPHVYYKKIKIKPDHRALLLSEFGGYSYGVKGHMPLKPFGYKKFSSQNEYNQAVIDLYENEILPIRLLLSGCIYTQLSDVEDEINGLITFDRQVVKWDTQVLRDLNTRLIYGEEK